MLNNSYLAQSDDRKKRPRTAFSAAQIKALETEFERGKYLSVAKRTALAKQLHLTETQVNNLPHIYLNSQYAVYIDRILYLYKYCFANLTARLDQNLVSKSTHQVEAQVHVGRGNTGLPVLRPNRHWFDGPTDGGWRSTVAVQPSPQRTSCRPINDAQQWTDANATNAQLSSGLAHSG